MRAIPRRRLPWPVKFAAIAAVYITLIALGSALTGCAALKQWETTATAEEREQAAAAAENAAATAGSIGAVAGPAGAIIAAPFGVALMLLAARIRRGPSSSTTTATPTPIPSTGEGQ